MSARVLRAAGWILLAISFFGCSAWAAGQPAPIEISNDLSLENVDPCEW